jgi:hypothetical protein
MFSLDDQFERQNPSPSRFKKALKLVPKVLKINENNEKVLENRFGEFTD